MDRLRTAFKEHPVLTPYVVIVITVMLFLQLWHVYR